MLTTRPSLIERLGGGRGDDDSWRLFAELYGPVVQRLGQRQGLGPEACEALIQEFLVHALEVLPRFRYHPELGRFRGWVRTVALHLILMRRRKESAERNALDRYRDQDRELEVSNELEDEWDEAERRRILELALQRLRTEVAPDRYAFFQLSALEGWPVEKVARLYGVRPNHVSVVKCRLLKRLREHVDELGRELE